MDYTFQQLKVFMTIVQNKSLRKSADILCLTAPALTKQLQNLENIIGFKLFDRVANRLLLNEKGAAFFELIKPIFNQLERIKLIELPLIKSRKKKLKISMSHIFEQKIFTQLVSLRQKDSTFEYTLIVEHKNRQISLLRKYEIDLAIIVLSEQEVLTFEQEGFQIKPYLNIIMNGYVSKNLINSQSALQEQLHYLKLILQSEHITQFGIKQNILYFDSYMTILNAINKGVGYGFIPSSLIDNEIKNVLVNIDDYIDICIPSVNSYFVYTDSRIKDILGILSE